MLWIRATHPRSASPGRLSYPRGHSRFGFRRMSPTATPAGGSHAPLATRAFVLLCCAMFLGYGNHWMLLPVIPLYVDAHGGSASFAGLVLLAFSIPSILVRPFV